MVYFVSNLIFFFFSFSWLSMIENTSFPNVLLFSFFCTLALLLSTCIYSVYCPKCLPLLSVEACLEKDNMYDKSGTFSMGIWFWKAGWGDQWGWWELYLGTLGGGRWREEWQDNKVSCLGLQQTDRYSPDQQCQRQAKVNSCSLNTFSIFNSTVVEALLAHKMSLCCPYLLVWQCEVTKTDVICLW